MRFVNQIFPTTICISTDMEFDFDFEKLIEETEFETTLHGYGSEQSVDTHILDDHPELKSILEEEFLGFKDNVLKMGSTDAKLTTSWLTRTEPDCGSQVHTHKNSWYSGVLWLTDMPDNCALQLENPNNDHSPWALNEPEEWESVNTPIWEVFPEKNKMILFPSHVRHRIAKNTTGQDRYSLAFNFLPQGSIGYKDGEIYI